MPIKVPNDLPSRRVLEAEGVFIIKETDAVRQDIRPLRLALLNLMPDKERTETQFARLLGSTPLQVELTLLHTESYRSRHVSEEHLKAFYQTFPRVRDQKFDGLIVTGAPIETLPFEDVLYWRELSEILNWSTDNVHASCFICWGAQAALYHRYGVPKHPLPSKLFGVYRQHTHRQNTETTRSPLLVGMDDQFLMPVSRYTEVRAEDLPQDSNLQVLATSPESGLCIVEDPNYRSTYMFNHVEYDAYSLRDEFKRDQDQGVEIALPVNYFPNDDPTAEPINRWRAYAHLLFWNWIHRIYQTTPFDINEIGQNSQREAADYARGKPVVAATGQGAEATAREAATKIPA